MNSAIRRKTERIGERRKIYQPAWVVDPDVGFPNECALRDLSINGAMIETPCAWDMPEYVFLISNQEDHAVECKVRWRSERAMGIEFL